jgi:hypothetical protein
MNRSLYSERCRVFRQHVHRVECSTVSLLVPEQVVFSCETSPCKNASRAVAEERVLCRLVDLLVSFQVLECDEASTTDGTKLRLRAVPAGMVALTCQQSPNSVVFARQEMTYSLSAFDRNTLPHPSQDNPLDDPAREWDALRFLIPGGAAGGCAKLPKFVRSDTL